MVKRLYIDESGDHSFKDGATPDRRYLCLVGCAFDMRHYKESFHPAFESMKAKHFGHDPDDVVILHREDMKARRGIFSALRDEGKADAFHQDLLTVVAKANVTVFAVLIDKQTTRAKSYGLEYHPYHVGLLAMMERYCGWLSFTGKQGDILAESRGGHEDGQLKGAYRSVHQKGTRFRGADFFQKPLTSKELKLKKKEHNIAGLQLSDLLAYPIRRAMLHEIGRSNEPKGFTRKMLDSCSGKYNCHAFTGKVSGYGKVWLL